MNTRSSSRSRNDENIDLLHLTEIATLQESNNTLINKINELERIILANNNARSQNENISSKVIDLIQTQGLKIPNICLRDDASLQDFLKYKMALEQVLSIGDIWNTIMEDDASKPHFHIMEKQMALIITQTLGDEHSERTLMYLNKPKLRLESIYNECFKTSIPTVIQETQRKLNDLIYDGNILKLVTAIRHNSNLINDIVKDDSCYRDAKITEISKILLLTNKLNKYFKVQLTNLNSSLGRQATITEIVGMIKEHETDSNYNPLQYKDTRFSLANSRILKPKDTTDPTSNPTNSYKRNNRRTQKKKFKCKYQQKLAYNNKRDTQITLWRAERERFRIWWNGRWVTKKIFKINCNESINFNCNESIHQLQSIDVIYDSYKD